ncbi:MAG TPA: TonB-dependent receptor [Fontimonas sp.]
MGFGASLWSAAATAQESQTSDDAVLDNLFAEPEKDGAEASAGAAADEATAPTPEPASEAEAASEPGSEPPPATDIGTVDESIPVDSLRPPAKPALPAEPEHARSTQLEEIVVTARKRTETLQEVPLSVTAFNAKDMEQRGFTGLDDIAAATPGFTFESFITGGAHGNPVIRGLAQTFTTSRIQNVSFFLDGVYLQRQSMLNLGMVDMERIEVVKGPQNALYGRNAFAGAVNYVTLEPTDRLEGYLSAGTGDDDRTEYRASISGPITGSGTLLGKATIGVSSYDGATPNDHPVANANPPGPNLRGNLGGSDDTTYSVGLLYEPGSLYKLRINYYHSEFEHETGPGYSLSGVNAARFGLRFDDQNDLNCNVATVDDISPFPPRTHTGFTSWCGELPRYASDVAERRVNGIVVDPRAIGTITETDALTFSANINLTDMLSLNYLFGWADHSSYTDGGVSDEDPLVGRGIVTNALVTTLDNQNPAGYTFANTASGRPNSVLDTTSHELRLDWTASDTLRGSFGGYYSAVSDEEWTTLYISDLCNADTPENIANCSTRLSAPNHLRDRTVITVAPAYDQFTRQHGGTRSEWTGFEESIAAVFASATYVFTPTLDGTVEARMTFEDKAVDRYTDSFALAPGQSITYLPPADPVLPFGNTLESTIAVPHDKARFNQFTPRAILNWGFADDHMAYVSVAKGVKSGGFNNANTEAELTYEDEENWTYELGSKNLFFDRRFMLNGAVYFIDWTGLQGGIPPSVAGLSTSDIIANIGGATSLGVELETRFALNEAFSVDAGGTYNDAQYKDGTKYAAGEQVNGSVHCDGITCPADGDISSNQLARTSKVQYNVGLNFDAFFSGWMLNARVDHNYQSKQFVEPLNLAWVPERGLTNASIKFVSPAYHWEFIAWGKNLTDEDYAANSFVIGVFNQYMVGKGPGRTWGANVKYKFF